MLDFNRRILYNTYARLLSGTLFPPFVFTETFQPTVFLIDSLIFCDIC